MLREEIGTKPLGLWLLSALTLPICTRVVGMDPLSVLPVMIGCGLLCMGIWFLSGGSRIKENWYAGIQMAWLPLAMVQVLSMTNRCWPESSHPEVMTLVLLVLAGSSAWNGAYRASGVGSVVLWMLALLYAVILVGGVGNLRLSYLMPEPQRCSPGLIFVFLLPVVITFLPRQNGTLGVGTIPAFWIITVILMLVTTGTLGPLVAKQETFAFYEYSRSMNLSGIAERMEAFVSVALTMGAYSLLSLLLSCGGCLAESGKPGMGRKGILFYGMAAVFLWAICPEIPESILGWGTLLFWGFLPLSVYAKKGMKMEKNA